MHATHPNAIPEHFKYNPEYYNIWKYDDIKFKDVDKLKEKHQWQSSKMHASFNKDDGYTGHNNKKQSNKRNDKTR